MINKDTIVTFLESYGLADATIEPITSGLSSFASLIDHGGKKYVLKIYSKDSPIETEVQFGDYLNKNGIPTAKIIENLKSQIITEIDGLRGALFEFRFGNPMEWDDVGTSFSDNLAEVVAKMHVLMLDNRKIPAKDYYKCDIDSAEGLSNTKITDKRREVADSVKDIVFSDLRRGLIHADLTRQNVLVSGDKNSVDSIIDFGDAHYDYFAWDLAILITHIYITKTYGIDWPALDAFVKKYKSLFPLTGKEINAIIPFIKIRNINLAIEVNRSVTINKNNIDELISIENSVMAKLDLVEKNQDRLEELLKENR